MAVVRFKGLVTHKQINSKGNVYLTLKINESYILRHIHSIEKLVDHVPRTNVFFIRNEKPLTCVNNVDIANGCKIGDCVTIKAYELSDLNGKYVNNYDVIDLDNRGSVQNASNG